METQNTKTKQKIRDIIEKEEWDVCLVGVELANEYSTNDTNYEQIWMGVQDLFENKMMAGITYKPKEEYKEELLNKIVNFIEKL